MTDIEICKRIAEIEGLRNHTYFNKIQVDRTPNKSIKTGWINWEDYNPLTDDALCFQLMVKYETGCSTCGNFTDTHEKAWCAKVAGSKGLTIEASPNKAICLAIIEAHND